MPTIDTKRLPVAHPMDTMTRSKSPNAMIENPIAARRLAAKNDSSYFARAANRTKIISRASGGRIAIAISEGPSDHVPLGRRMFRQGSLTAVHTPNARSREKVSHSQHFLSSMWSKFPEGAIIPQFSI
jgi:hypothetical protein